MPSTGYLIVVLAIVFTITLALRAVPLRPLEALRESCVVGRWRCGWRGHPRDHRGHRLARHHRSRPGRRALRGPGRGCQHRVHLAFGRRTILSIGICTTWSSSSTPCSPATTPIHEPEENLH